MQEFYKTESGVRDTLMVSMPDEKLGTALSHRESNIAGPSPVAGGRGGWVGAGGGVSRVWALRLWGQSVAFSRNSSCRSQCQRAYLLPRSLQVFGEMPPQEGCPCWFGGGAHRTAVLGKFWSCGWWLARPPLQSSRGLSLQWAVTDGITPPAPSVLEALEATWGWGRAPHC